ncbi:hypothetical protein [Pseudomonas putida]|uniref:Uncharacterized protein n=1 Tax=Pseudomonas putida TaxID=303 RepID=A0A8I1EBY1_PSEPU|nr:hypothetical protein [Pseudomonas putida]MBI6882469.1 hypothetical protein [Pseudomonas putida]
MQHSASVKGEACLSAITNYITLITALAGTLSSTLAFWFLITQVSALPDGKFVFISMSYLALISGYYGSYPLGQVVGKYVGRLLALMFSADAPEKPSVDLGDSSDSLETLVDGAATQVVRIEILQIYGAPNPDLPSTFFPGAGTDGARFIVISGQAPSRNKLHEALLKWDGDCCLMDYDQEKGEGYFTMIDADAPEIGVVIDLPIKV